MTDLEMTKLCAEAMGYRPDKDGGYSRLHEGAGMAEPAWFPFIYNPLHDDAQAMALLKRFELQNWLGKTQQRGWRVCPYKYGCSRNRSVINDDLNRAIVECVAKIQKARA